MSELNCVPFDYTVLRVVPRVERQEFVNVGVVIFCKKKRYLNAQVDLELVRLAAIAPYIDPKPIRTRLALIPEICRGEVTIEPVQEWPLSERFQWLAAPSSTVIQAAPVHRGICEDPAARLKELYHLFVACGE